MLYWKRIILRQKLHILTSFQEMPQHQLIRSLLKRDIQYNQMNLYSKSMLNLCHNVVNVNQMRW